MKTAFYYLIRQPTFISIISLLYFTYILFLIVYKLFDPPKTGSAYNMILEMLLISSVVPLGLYIIDRLLVIKINNIKLTVIEAIASVSILLYYFMFVNPF